jgi:DNA mismatch repair protein MutS2
MLAENGIEERSLKCLEWDKLINYLAGHAQTAPGKIKAQALLPGRDADGNLIERQNLEAKLDLTEEALALITNHSRPDLTPLKSLDDTLELLRIGGTLSALDLLCVLRLLRLSKQVKSSFKLLGITQFPRLSEYIPFLCVLDKELLALESSLESDGTVKDSASGRLSGLRAQRRRLLSRIDSELASLIQAQSMAKVLQEPLYTVRNGRYVLPVIASMRSSLNGIVHDASQSGLTIYVEPLSVMELTNSKRIVEAEIEAEIQAILEGLCRMLVPHADSLALSYDKLIELDVLFAKGALASKYQGVKPQLSDTTCLSLFQARHPLLVLANQELSQSAHPTQEEKAREVIANDVFLGENRTLIITGPNTGGKTVLLKLIGLTALMLRSGMLLPVKVGSRLSLFSSVCADIGDEQSLEQSLSTFSAHLKNIVEIVDRASSAMLVLLDEVGAGTDPKEGAALAQAVLETLWSRGALTVATTHLGELKTLAFAQEGFLNASFEFDDISLSPTYKLRLGVPGSSKAHIIASRLGLASSVVERSVALMAQQELDLTFAIEQVSRKMNELDEEISESKKLKESLLEQELLLERRAKKLAEERERFSEEKKAEIEREFADAREIIRHTIADLQKKPSISAAQKTKDELDRFREALILPGVKKLEKKGPDCNLVVGMPVKVPALNQKGIIQEVIYTAKDSREVQAVVVQAGAMRLKVSLQELELLEGQKAVKSSGQLSKARKHLEPKKRGRQITFDGPEVFVRTTVNTLDLRGQRFEAASQAVESFVDSCALNGVTPFMIIHGHGTGALKNMCRDFLKTCSYPLRLRPGETYEGGDGVTVVELGR